MADADSVAADSNDPGPISRAPRPTTRSERSRSCSPTKDMALVALATAAFEIGNSRYLLTPSPKPRPSLIRAQERLGSKPVAGLSIEWPSPFPSRIRKVVTRSGAHRRYVVPCYRCGDVEAHGDAAEEAAAFILLDACPDVEFQEQPARFSFEWIGRWHQHVPDLLVATDTRFEFWECKRSFEAGRFWIRKRSERLQELLTPLGNGYRVVTGETLYRDSFLANARQLRRFAKRPMSETVIAEAALRTRTAGELAIHELADMLSDDEPASDVLALLYAGVLCTDLSRPLTRQSRVHLRTQEEHPWVWRLFDRVAA